MIYPTLFVGLGSTGLDILERLQDLVSEEYKEKLPIFSYVYLETDEAKKPKQEPGKQDEITVPTQFPVVRNLQTLRGDYQAGKKAYLKGWLNDKLLEFPTGAFAAGAGQIRMAGRLCLWENWAECTRLLTQGKSTITRVENISQTSEFLREFYNKVNMELKDGEQLVGAPPNVYIFGTLCGGTCGGMFIDIAYFLRDLFGLRTNRRQAKLQGIFTVPDSTFAHQPKSEQQKKQCANAWASIVELDYYNYPATTFEVTWPDGKSMVTSEPPLDLTYLVSCSGDDTNLLDHEGAPDLGALNQMVAMFLFTETVSDLLVKKEAIRINFMGHVRFNTPHPDTETMAALSTFGLSAYRYPKYRIAEAAACHQAADLCQAWLGTATKEENLKTEREGKEEWERILKEKLPIVTRRGDGAIEDDIRAWFDSSAAELISKPWEQNSLTLKKQLERLEEGKEWDRIMSDKLTLGKFEQEVKAGIRECVLGRFNRTCNYALTQTFIEALDNQIKATVDKLPTRYPRPDPGKIPGVVPVDFYAKFVLMKKPVEGQKRRAAIAECREYFIDSLARIRGFRARQALESIRKHLGAGVKSTGDEARVVETLTEEIAKLGGTLANVKKMADQRAHDLSLPMTATQNVAFIFNDEQGGLPQDIRDLCARMRNAGNAGIVRRIMSTQAGNREIQSTLYDFLRGGEGKVMEKLVVEFRRDSADQIAGFHIAEKLLQRQDANDQRLFARRALPHLELAGNLIPIEYPCFLVGGDRPNMPSLNKLAENLNDQNAGNRIDFGAPTATPLLDHFLVYYTETGLLYPDENLASSADLRQNYDEESRQDRWGLHTHKEGATHFDKLAIKRYREIQVPLDILTGLIYYRDSSGDWLKPSLIEQEEAAGTLTAGHFKADGGSLYILYKAQDGTDVTLLPNDYGRRQLAADRHGFAIVKREVVQIIKVIGTDGYAALINDYLRRFEAAEKAKGTPAEKIIQLREESRRAFLELRNRLLN